MWSTNDIIHMENIIQICRITSTPEIPMHNRIYRVYRVRLKKKIIFLM